MVAQRVDVAEIRLWGHTIAAVYWDRESSIAAFEYVPEFRGSGIEVAPLTMPLGSAIYRFPELARTSFQGMPGLLSDSLPDDFGNAVIDQWLAREGLDQADFSPVERLCYIGERGTGALEFRPARRATPKGSVEIEIPMLVELAASVLDQRRGLQVDVTADNAMDDILRVGSSAGGARAKAVVAWNPATGAMRSGQVKAGSGFEYWLLKFDGVDNREHGVRDPSGYGLIEYAYHKMAVAAGIEMAECRLFREGGRSHFMTRRFDRDLQGEKIHMLSLAGIAHLDHQQPGAHSYEQAMQVIESLHLPVADMEQQFRRMVFNVLSRNQDDHSKNIAFLMDKSGSWRLAPAFDVIYAYNPSGAWTSRHQMTINGKADDFSLDDFLDVARRFRVSRPLDAIREVSRVLQRWPEFAEKAGIATDVAKKIQAAQRTGLFAEL
jgi:serine/threonine-protein kinase HipA